MSKFRYYVIDSAEIDDGYTWYSIHSRDMELWQWIAQQSPTMWQNIKGVSAFDIRADLYTFLTIKFGR